MAHTFQKDIHYVALGCKHKKVKEVILWEWKKNVRLHPCCFNPMVTLKIMRGQLRITESSNTYTSTAAEQTEPADEDSVIRSKTELRLFRQSRFPMSCSSCQAQNNWWVKMCVKSNFELLTVCVGQCQWVMTWCLIEATVISITMIRFFPPTSVHLAVWLQTELTNSDAFPLHAFSPTFPPTCLGFTFLIKKKCHRRLANFIPFTAPICPTFPHYNTRNICSSVAMKVELLSLSAIYSLNQHPNVWNPFILKWEAQPLSIHLPPWQLDQCCNKLTLLALGMHNLDMSSIHG